MKNTSISNEAYLLENEDRKETSLRIAIQKGLESPRVENFDFDENLNQQKAKKRKKGKLALRQEAIGE